jgi:release factor glutamine methyltransferase
MKVNEIIKKYQNSIGRIDAELLLVHILKKNREFVFTHSDQKINLLQKIKFIYLVKKRKIGYSVAVIVGHKEFFNLDFEVNKYTLIPRPETEVMVEKVLKIINLESTLIDVGTGSGCIPIAIAKNSIPKKIIAIDISKKALKVAKKNAIKHNVKIKFIASNLLNKITTIPKNTIITANLPYLTEKQFQEEKSIQKEPKKALIAKNSGLEFYKKLFKKLKQKNAPNGTVIFLEIDSAQNKKIKKLIKNIFPKSNILVHKDLKKLDRIIEIII